MTAYVHTTSFARAKDMAFSRAWIAGEGTPCVSVSLAPDASITLHSIEEADALVAAAADAKVAMQALADGRRAWLCGRCGRLTMTSEPRPESRSCDRCALPPPASEPSAGCDGTHPDGVWLCNAAAGHEPLDHASYDPETGGVCARWPSVRAEGGGE